MLTQAGMLKRWRVALDGDAQSRVESFARQIGEDAVVAALLLGRGIDQPDAAKSFLNPKLTDLIDPGLMPGIDRAAARIVRAVRDKQPIVVYGDYDVDGVTASAILWHTLRLAGAEVSSYVPHRIDEGYGINSDAIIEIARTRGRDGAAPLIISVDCGITAVEPAKVAREYGADLIITDHHEFNPASLPDAFALVHPRLELDGKPPYPFPELCGAGVAFKVAWQVAKELHGPGRLPQAFRDLLLDLLSLAALGTVADVVPLRGENRVITSHGLGQIKRTKFIGLNALIDASRLRDEKIDSFHVGFVLGPRLNACGRMGHAARAVHLLTDADEGQAREVAEFLNGENDRRRATERAIYDEARQIVVQRGYNHDDCRAIVLGKEGWHPGVVGIVASRLVEAFGRPVVLMNIHEGEAHGSARSVEGVSIHDAFHHCAPCLSTYGGHAMAAGLRLQAGRIDEFRSMLVGFVNERLAVDELVPILDIDLECTLDELTPELVRRLEKLAPFGRDNPKPVLCARNLRIERQPTRLGAEGKHLALSLRQGAKVARAVWWQQGDYADQLTAGMTIDAAFEPQINTWQGVSRVELHLRDIRASEG